MKNSKICPKCSSNNIIRIQGTVGPHGSGNNVDIGLFKGYAYVTRYLCCNCGFSEEWVEDKSDLEKLANEYRNR